MQMPLLIRTSACDMHGVSNQAVAASIATAVLQDMQMVSQDSKSKVIDRNKVRRKRLEKCEELTHDTIANFLLDYILMAEKIAP